MQNHGVWLFVIIVFRKCDNITYRFLLPLCLVFRSFTFDLYDDVFSNCGNYGHVRIARDWNVFIDLESGF